MKLLYDLGEYEPIYVEFDVYSLAVKLFKRVVGKPIAEGEFTSIGRKKKPVTYLKTLLVKTHDEKYFTRHWKKVQKQKLEKAKDLKAVTYTASIYSLDPAEYSDLKTYLKYILRENKKNIKKNNFITDLIRGLEIY